VTPQQVSRSPTDPQGFPAARRSNLPVADLFGNWRGSSVVAAALPTIQCGRAETTVTRTGEHAQSCVLDVQLARSTDLAELRRRVDAALGSLGADHRYDVLLVVSELVSNVFDHTAGAGRLRLARTWSPCQVVVEVDDSSAHRPVCGRSRLGEHRGRGMVMVDSMSCHWGTTPRFGGKTVFAQLRCGGTGMAADSCAAAG
jgi:anti-sigma regulatory factor (Ser/Thr protein kinase)